MPTFQSREHWEQPCTNLRIQPFFDREVQRFGTMGPISQVIDPAHFSDVTHLPRGRHEAEADGRDQ